MAKEKTTAVVESKEKVVEYTANGEKIKLSPSMIKRYLVNGNGTVTDGEIMMFQALCRYQHLNPFLREAYLIKYGNSTPATIVVGKDVFIKRAEASPTYAGKQAGVIVTNKNGEIIEREGSLVLPTETLVGGWAKVYRKDRATPDYAAVTLDEYVGTKGNGEVNSSWAKRPATMIRKVALMQALRDAFPKDLEGLYAQEEFSDVSDMKLDAQAVVAEEIKNNENSVEFVEPDEIVDGEVIE